MLNNNPPKIKEKNTKKSKQLKVLAIDLLDQEKLDQEKLDQQKQKRDIQINNIDLRYFANQNPSFKTNKLEQLLSNNYLLKDIYDNIEENIANFKEQIIKYNETTLEKLIENNSKIMSGEKYKLYYLLYILNYFVIKLL